MYHRLRQIHLFAAFLLTIFILMYFVTGFIMIFEEAFERNDIAVSSITLKLPGARFLSAEDVVSKLKEEAGIRGQHLIREGEKQRLIIFRRPGTETEVNVSRTSDSVTVVTKRKNAVSTLHQFHRLHGYRGGFNYVAWSFVYDLSAISMIVFAFTGVYLWYKTERPRWPGWIVLIGFTFFVAYTLYYLQVLQ